MADLFDDLRARGAIDPVLFRAMFASQIGEECPFPTIKAAADKFGVGAEQYRLFIRGKREPEPKLLAALGFEKVVLYASAQRIEAGTDETPQAAQPDGREPDPAGDAPKTPRHSPPNGA